MTKFPHKSLLIDTKLSRLHKAFGNGSSANMNLSKTQLSKMVRLRQFLGLLDFLLSSPEVLKK